ncbi:heavy metal-associated isoprenylated plant protein 43-like [Pistacia vera]|uniref:heavy metal-associated isoprenylated plant protein 43-like n=1 Tax=Pistacia vera TaxID=55513 RepID=UPI0012631485|nr:heavy metal-associated isoprenylated plant protein 43-like [Pistacia vera]
MKKIVIKVAINCQICKTDVMKAVTKLTGIDQVSVDGEKGTLTVVGDVDPVLVVKRLKKIKKCPQIVSIGPPKPPEPEKPKPEPFSVPCLPPSCKDCQLVAVGYYSPYEGRLCSIL